MPCFESCNFTDVDSESQNMISEAHLDLVQRWTDLNMLGLCPWSVEFMSCISINQMDLLISSQRSITSKKYYDYCSGLKKREVLYKSEREWIIYFCELQQIACVPLSLCDCMYIISLMMAGFSHFRISSGIWSTPLYILF